MEPAVWGQLVSWPSLVVQLAIALVAIAIRRRYLSELSDIPGPFWASITRLWHVFVILEGQQNLRLKALHRKHGHFVRIAPREVSVSHPEARWILQDDLFKADWYKVTSVPDRRFQNPMSTTDPKKKKALSKHFARGYGLSQVLQHEVRVDENIRELLHWLNVFAKDQKPMDLGNFVTFTTFDNVGSVFLSKPFGFIKAGCDIGGTLKNNVALSKFAAVAGFFLIPLRILVNPLTSGMMFLPMGHLYRTTSNAMRVRMKDHGSERDILSQWLREWERHPKLTLRQIEAQLNVNVGAGAEPVSTAIQSTIYHIIQYPTALAKVRAEIADAQENGLCLGDVVSFRDANRLPYLQACIKESLRMFSPTTMGLPRKVPEGGLTIGSRFFTKGTILSVSSQVIHASTEIWGPDAGQWKPQRWLIGDTRDMEKNWLVFSAGYMTCPGRHFAMMQIVKVTASLIRDFDFDRVDPKKAWKWQANFTALTHSWPVWVRHYSGDSETSRASPGQQCDVATGRFDADKSVRVEPTPIAS
ncbi:cytochrome P450 [Emericellopsis atlantica]|uniref:Cytochrome P450 n=1 Tax=Emericellopsis atlantica TaxID=2614577 RepID=A0A9P7ZFD7_9HYPO|nr:cytochrome P450 [Emericellopsis atlantica]KAG9250652.1 cytochrome P450 [Emericellopsis atlantica]